jgi:hypothetical protein
MALVEHAIAAKEGGVAVYPVPLLRSASYTAVSGGAASGRFGGASSGMPRPRVAQDMAYSGHEFSKLARETGGEVIAAIGGNEVVPQILKAMAERVRFDYVAGYYPSAPAGGKRRHNVEVVLKEKARGRILGGKRIVVH